MSFKIVKNASGKTVIKISQKDWEEIGKQHGWLKTSQLNIDPAKVKQLAAAIQYFNDYILKHDLTKYGEFQEDKAEIRQWQEGIKSHYKKFIENNNQAEIRSAAQTIIYGETKLKHAFRGKPVPSWLEDGINRVKIAFNSLWTQVPKPSGDSIPGQNQNNDPYA